MIEFVEGAFADWDAEPLLARLAEVGVPAGKVRTLDEVYAWDQTASQGLLIDVEHATLGGSRCPDRRCGSSRRGAEVTRGPRRAPDARRGQRRDPRLAGRRVLSQLAGLDITANWTPSGSLSRATRPYGVFSGGCTTVPPLASAWATVASVSATST